MTSQRAPALLGVLVVVLGALLGSALEWAPIAYYGLMAVAIIVYFATLSVVEHR